MHFIEHSMHSELSHLGEESESPALASVNLNVELVIAQLVEIFENLAHEFVTGLHQPSMITLQAKGVQDLYLPMIGLEIEVNNY